MSDEMRHDPSVDDNEYEHKDLGTHGVFVFMISLIVSGLFIYFIIYGMYTFLDKYEQSQMTTASPLITGKGTVARVMTAGDMDKDFKDNGAPMLEIDERTQMKQFLLDQEDQLNSYGGVDEKAGVAHIPIERAIELTAQRGIPVYGQAATPKPESKPKPEGRMTAKK